MYLETLVIKNFRSSLETVVYFKEDLTILAGENNAGKSNILDAIRLITIPLNERRERYAEMEDIRRGSDTEEFTLIANYDGLTDTQKGLLITAMPEPTSSKAIFGM